MALDYLLLETTGKVLQEDGTSGVLLESSVFEPRPIRINTSQGWADIGDATSFVSGTGAPTAAIGATGAVYLDTATGLLYGPKAGGAWPGTPIPGATAADATTSAKGVVQLAGDLAGTATSPQIAAGAIVNADVNAAAAIAESKLLLATDAAAGTGSRRTLGTGASQAAAGNDSRFLVAAVSYATTLPASPVDGQEAVLVDSTSNPSYQWRFRYNAGSSSAYKWEFVGGVPIVAQVDTAESVTVNTGYQDIATAGPQLTLARAGDYVMEFGVRLLGNPNTSFVWRASPKFGAAATAELDAAVFAGADATGAVFVCSVANLRRPTGLGAGIVVKLQYAADTFACSVDRRWITATPIRVA